MTNCVYIVFYKKMEICHLMFVNLPEGSFSFREYFTLIPNHTKTIASS